MKLEYRILVGEIGNDKGHFSPPFQTTPRGAKCRLTRAINAYGGDGWGRLEYREMGQDEWQWQPYC